METLSVDPGFYMNRLVSTLIALVWFVVVGQQAVTNWRTLYEKGRTRPWPVLMTLVMVLGAFIFDFKAIAGVVGYGDASGSVLWIPPEFLDRLLTGSAASGGINSIYQMGKKFVEAGDQIRQLKVEERRQRVSSSTG